MANSMAHADLNVLSQTASQAGSVADGINNQLRGFQSVAAAQRGHWAGTSVTAFETRVDAWNAAVMQLVQQLHALGRNVQVSGTTYLSADESSAHGFNSGGGTGTNSIATAITA